VGVSDPATLRLPEELGDDVVHLRRWVIDDTEALGRVVTVSLEHLRPWMPWIASEPLSLAERRELIAGWERNWAKGGDVLLGVFMAAEIVGSGGLHRRIAPDGLEIGYWIHPGHVRRGLASRTAALLTTLGLSAPGITHIEIHHDQANVASAGVARKLGFALIAEEADVPEAPGEVGVEWRWRMEAEAWQSRLAEVADRASLPAG
jgi:RimJ/RimL family protein N-acetyltransferase